MINAEVADEFCAAVGLRESDLMDAMRRLMERDFRRAVKQQALAAKAGGERLIFRAKCGVEGYVAMSVHPFFVHWWGQKLGYECWDDPTHIKWWLNHHPECRVKSVSATPTITVGVIFGADGRVL